MKASTTGPLANGRNKTILALDSGEFSRNNAKKKGKIITININRLIFFQLMCYEQVDLCFNLDVIDPKDDRNGEVSYQNWEYNRQYRPDVIPIYHWGKKKKDLKYLERYMGESEYVAVGGCADLPPGKRKEELDHLWETHLLDRHRRPRAKIHGLGLTSAELVARWHWHSVDSTSWAIDAGNRIILVPQKSSADSGYNYTETPIRVSVTLRCFPRPPRDHISELSVDKAHHVMEYLKTMGFPIGRGYTSDKDYEPGLCNSATMRYQINALYYQEMSRETRVKVYLAGNKESLAKPEMERSIRQAVFDKGLDYYRMISFADNPKILNIIRMKEEENHEIKSRSGRTQTA